VKKKKKKKKKNPSKKIRLAKRVVYNYSETLSDEPAEKFLWRFTQTGRSIPSNELKNAMIMYVQVGPLTQQAVKFPQYLKERIQITGFLRILKNC
jgi:hypothetical protein